jgi:hypothetical protein
MVHLNVKTEIVRSGTVAAVSSREAAHRHIASTR